MKEIQISDGRVMRGKICSTVDELKSGDVILNRIACGIWTGPFPIYAPRWWLPAIETGDVFIVE